MKYSFATMAMPGMKLEEVIKVAKEYGFDGVDLRVKDEDGDIFESSTVNDLLKIKKMFEKGPLISSLLCYNKRLCDGKKNMENSILRCVEIAEILSVDIIRIFTGKLKNEEELKEVAEVLNNVFKKYNSSVKVLIQNHRNNGVTCKQGEFLKKYIPDERFGIILSPEHEDALNNDMYEEAKRVSKITKQLYVSDAKKDGTLCLIGDGIVDFKKIISILKEQGFDGFITLKWEKCWEDYLPSYDKAFDSFNKYFKEE